MASKRNVNIVRGASNVTSILTTMFLDVALFRARRSNESVVATHGSALLKVMLTSLT